MMVNDMEVNNLPEIELRKKRKPSLKTFQVMNLEQLSRNVQLLQLRLQLHNLNYGPSTDSAVIAGFGTTRNLSRKKKAPFPRAPPPDLIPKGFKPTRTMNTTKQPKSIKTSNMPTTKAITNKLNATKTAVTTKTHNSTKVAESIKSSVVGKSSVSVCCDPFMYHKKRGNHKRSMKSDSLRQISPIDSSMFSKYGYTIAAGNKVCITCSDKLNNLELKARRLRR